MSPIKDLNVTYEALNEEETFSAGDTVVGTVAFTLTKETKVKCLMVKAKGDANVHWSEGSGDNRKSYSDHRRYFKLKEYLVAENAKGTVLPQGVHRFKFRFTIPQGDMPPSWDGMYGKIVYMLEAKMSRSWRLDSLAQKKLKFVSKSFSHPGQVMCPQSGSVEKGQVQMSATINKKVCSPGDTLSVVAKICNSSSKETRPKFSFQQRVEYRAIASRKFSEQSLCKMVGETIAQNSEETVSCQLEIPADVTYTIQNCEIISVAYYLKVYMDIRFAIDPAVEFPLVVVPASFAALQPGEAEGPYPAGAAGAPGYSDFPPPAFPSPAFPPAAFPPPAFPPPAFPPPAFPIGPYPVPAGSGAYGYPAPDPSQHGNMTSGWNNQWPQQAAPYGFPSAAPSAVQHQDPTAPPLSSVQHQGPTAPPLSSVQHQGPTAPPLFQQGEEPPSYTSLFSPSQDFLGSTGSDHKS